MTYVVCHDVHRPSKYAMPIIGAFAVIVGHTECEGSGELVEEMLVVKVPVGAGERDPSRLTVNVTVTDGVDLYPSPHKHESASPEPQH